MNDGYMSRDRAHLAKLQRQRRARMVRVDYMPAPEAFAILQARRAQERPGSAQATNSAILDAILREWARMTGIKYRCFQTPITSDDGPEFSDTIARANDSGFCHPKSAPARVNKYGGPVKPPRFAGTGANDSGQTRQVSAARVPCGARRRRDGLPCQALSVPGKARCKWHGGCSTGPRKVLESNSLDDMTRLLAADSAV
jgi:hypothetical protein